MKNNKCYLLIIVTAILCYQVNLYAATIVLRSGAAVKGKLIERNEDEITIQDLETKQLRKIKAIFIKDLVLDPGEEKIVDKDEKKRKEREKEIEKEKEKEREKERKRAQGGGAAPTTDLLTELDPTVGLLPGIAMPVGKVGKVMSLGYGFHAFFDVGIPMPTTMFKIRPGLSAGFLYNTTKGGSSFSLEKRTPTIMMLPIIAYFKFQFIAPHGIRPYIKLGGGITPVLATNATSMDPTFAPGVGLGYVNEKIPYLEFYVDLGFLMAFEKVRGDFLTASIGIAYRFGAPSSTVSINLQKK
jgi:hypothetical protein